MLQRLFKYLRKKGRRGSCKGGGIEGGQGSAQTMSYGGWGTTWYLKMGHEKTVPDRNTGSCLDPGLPGSGLQRGKGEGAEAGPGPPNREEKDHLESSRDG